MSVDSAPDRPEPTMQRSTQFLIIIAMLGGIFLQAGTFSFLAKVTAPAVPEPEVTPTAVVP